MIISFILTLCKGAHIIAFQTNKFYKKETGNGF